MPPSVVSVGDGDETDTSPLTLQECMSASRVLSFLFGCRRPIDSDSLAISHRLTESGMFWGKRVDMLGRRDAAMVKGVKMGGGAAMLKSAAHRPLDDERDEEAEQAGRFGRARAARSSELTEDYVELISDLLAGGGEARPVDVARRLGVANATAIKMIGRLKREGLVSGKPYRGIFLTDAGQRLADEVRARHRVVVDLLLAVGVPLEDAEADAEGIEHYVSANTLKAFLQFLTKRKK
jgi:DtxR family transcriptional regulator, manganese transport regulator